MGCNRRPILLAPALEGRARVAPAAVARDPAVDLLGKVLRPGDIYTHCYSGLRGEQQGDTGGPSAALIEGRKRGVIFDVGHRQGESGGRIGKFFSDGHAPRDRCSGHHPPSENSLIDSSQRAA